MARRTIQYEDILDALDSVTWYNDLAKEILSWKNLDEDSYGLLSPTIRDPQVQVIWMICCVLFGDYGTSPRTGWITDIEGFHDFLDSITATYQFSCAIDLEDADDDDLVYEYLKQAKDEIERSE